VFLNRAGLDVAVQVIRSFIETFITGCSEGSETAWWTAMEGPKTISPLAIPDHAPISRASKTVLWKWSFVATAAILVFLMWQCGSALYRGRQLAETAVREFHRNFNTGQYEQVYLAADPTFAQNANHEELLKLLEAVHRKLGDAKSEKLLSLNVNTLPSGTFIITRYTTVFTLGTATETFTWIKRGSTLKLYGYNIQSNALILDK
jgi:Protein of unknown function (DUF4019)